MPGRPEGDPSVILGAGYAGLATWHAAHQRSRGRWPILLVDRHPVHVLRTELYRVGRIAAAEGALSRWAIPLRQALRGDSGAIRTGTVEAIDLADRTVTLDGTPLRFRELVICLGSVPAYYGVAGAAENTLDVYRLSDAQKLAQAIRSALGGRGREGAPVRVAVIGGGSTGTEVAAEIATVRWEKVVGRPCPPVRVLLVAGKLPLLAGLPEPLVHHARALLGRAGVVLDEGRNVTEVHRESPTLEDGTVLPFDVAVWAAGIHPPPVVEAMEAAHGRGHRLIVDEHLELPDHPGVFALGDVAEFIDPRTHLAVPATAQAALAEAPIAGANLVARRRGRPLAPFQYREKGVIVALGIGHGSGMVGHLSVWGRPAALLQRAVQVGHRYAAERGGTPPGL